MHCCIPTPTTDNNTSTGMTRVTLNMDGSAVNRQGDVTEFHIVWRVVTMKIVNAVWLHGYMYLANIVLWSETAVTLHSSLDFPVTFCLVPITRYTRKTVGINCEKPTIFAEKSIIFCGIVGYFSRHSVMQPDKPK